MTAEPNGSAGITTELGTDPNLSLACEDSLSRTLDAVDAAAFDGVALPDDARERVALWIARRQGAPGAKSGSFAGFPAELRAGIVAFTGERFTQASGRHILGEEACRVLRRLSVPLPEVETALERANAGLLQAVSQAEFDPRYDNNPGAYCCGKCSVGVWRNLISGGLDRREERLRMGIGKFLRATRTEDGRWRVFPFWYTVLALSEADLDVARAELEYAAPVLERTARRAAPAEVYGRRRHELARRVLSTL